MSTRRAARLPPTRKDANGKPLCRHCGKDVEKGRRYWCGQACIDDYLVRANPGHARKLVRKRDKGVCVLCGLHCVEMQKAFQQELHRMQATLPASERYTEETRIALAVKMGLAERFGRRSADTWWEMDHIVPVAEGGGECGLDNLRTLCIECHYAETVKLRQRLAEQHRKSSDS